MLFSQRFTVSRRLWRRADGLAEAPAVNSSGVYGSLENRTFVVPLVCVVFHSCLIQLHSFHSFPRHLPSGGSFRKECQTSFLPFARVWTLVPANDLSFFDRYSGDPAMTALLVARSPLTRPLLLNLILYSCTSINCQHSMEAAAGTAGPPAPHCPHPKLSPFAYGLRQRIRTPCHAC